MLMKSGKVETFPRERKKFPLLGHMGGIVFIHGIIFGFIDLVEFGLNGRNWTRLRSDSCIQVEIAALRLIWSERRRYIHAE